MSVEGIKTNKFRPLELNERNVNTTFNRCLPTGEELENYTLNHHTQVFIPELTKRESQRISLSKDKVQGYKSTIRYLVGQIKSFHSDKSAFMLQEGFIRYDGTVWTRDYEILFKLYNLALSSALISDFALASSDMICSVKSPECNPTLSPKDPNFETWYEEYKGKHPELF